MTKTETTQDVDWELLARAAKMSSREINDEINRLLDKGDYDLARRFANIWLRRDGDADVRR